MARPTKAVKVKSGALSSEDSRARQFMENVVQGSGDAPAAPAHLTDAQREVYAYIVDGLNESNILGKLDVFTLEAVAVAIVRVRQINQMIEADPKLLFDNALQNTRSKFQTEFWRGCNELCLSPQSRAKLGSVAANALKKQEDPLIKALSADD